MRGFALINLAVPTMLYSSVPSSASESLATATTTPEVLVCYVQEKAC